MQVETNARARTRTSRHTRKKTKTCSYERQTLLTLLLLLFSFPFNFIIIVNVEIRETKAKAGRCDACDEASSLLSTIFLEKKNTKTLLTLMQYILFCFNIRSCRTSSEYTYTHTFNARDSVYIMCIATSSLLVS